MTRKTPPNHGKDWTRSDVGELRRLTAGNTPTWVMGIKLGRTPEAIETKASEKDISLKPTNQSPYGTKK